MVSLERIVVGPCDRGGSPVIAHPHFTGTGTRNLRENGRRAIAELFERSVFD